MPFSDIDAYALYLSYATLVLYTPFVNDMLFQLSTRHIFGGFWWNMRLLVLIILKYSHFAKKYVCMVPEITLTSQNLLS